MKNWKEKSVMELKRKDEVNNYARLFLLTGSPKENILARVYCIQNLPPIFEI